MKRVAAFVALALALFVAPYLITEREVFFPPAAAQPRIDASGAEAAVAAFVRALPEAYRAGSAAALAPLARDGAALAPLEADLRFLASRGERLELTLLALSVAAEPGSAARVRTRERWRVGGGGGEFSCSAVFLLDSGRIAGWEIFP